MAKIKSKPQTDNHKKDDSGRTVVDKSNPEHKNRKSKPFKLPVSVKPAMRKLLKKSRLTPLALANNIMIEHAMSHNLALPPELIKVDHNPSDENFLYQRRILLNKIAKAIDGIEFEFAQTPEDSGKIKLSEKRKGN